MRRWFESLSPANKRKNQLTPHALIQFDDKLEQEKPHYLLLYLKRLFFMYTILKLNKTKAVMIDLQT